MTNADALKVLVLAHDLTNVNVHRRIKMLHEGGASVTVAGFRRTSKPVTLIEGCSPVDFGRTYDGRFLQRIWSVIREIALLRRYQALFADADIILARNMEMLAIAVRGQSLTRSAPVIVYECIDIHRLLLRMDLIGAAMRWLEGRLARHSAALFTSSLAFVSGYFDPLSKVKLPVRLVENKVLEFDLPPNSLTIRSPGPPWIIGWFGMIRCKKSLSMLADLARQSQGTVEVVIRGRPSPSIFRDFEKTVAALPGLHFLGPYKPGDLASMYSSVHYSWAIDMFEEGLNSSWLLPNRLYEGGAYNCVPIALEAVETGHFLKRLGIGVTLPEPLGQSLANFFKNLTSEKYRALEDAVAQIPRATWAYDSQDCTALVNYMRSLSESHNG